MNAWLLILIRRLIRAGAYLWASPWTLFGALLGLCGLCSGGGFQSRLGVLEFHGGICAWLLRKAPLSGGAAAITFGHTVLARSEADLDYTRAHERVHVEQYERWGPFFVPAYLLCSAWLLFRRKSPYWDNPFEREAYARAP